MSCAAAHESKKVLRMCRSCSDRKARFQYRGEVRADREHVLCFECYRAETNRQRALKMAESPFGRRLSPRELDHRRRMLAHLAIFRPLAASGGDAV